MCGTSCCSLPPFSLEYCATQGKAWGLSDTQEAKSLAFKICVFPLTSVLCAHTYLLT